MTFREKDDLIPVNVRHVCNYYKLKQDHWQQWTKYCSSKKNKKFVSFKVGIFPLGGIKLFFPSYCNYYFWQNVKKFFDWIFITAVCKNRNYGCFFSGKSTKKIIVNLGRLWPDQKICRFRGISGVQNKQNVILGRFCALFFNHEKFLRLVGHITYTYAKICRFGEISGYQERTKFLLYIKIKKRNFREIFGIQELLLTVLLRKLVGS